MLSMHGDEEGLFMKLGAENSLLYMANFTYIQKSSETVIIATVTIGYNFYNCYPYKKIVLSSFKKKKRINNFKFVFFQ